jgi:transposase
MVEVSPTAPVRAMELITILNRCHRFRGFVYQQAHFSADKKSIEVAVRPRKSSVAICSRCHLPAPGYDQLGERRFEFIPLRNAAATIISLSSPALRSCSGRS